MREYKSNTHNRRMDARSIREDLLQRISDVIRDRRLGMADIRCIEPSITKPQWIALLNAADGMLGQARLERIATALDVMNGVQDVAA